MDKTAMKAVVDRWKASLAKTMPERFIAVRATLSELGSPATAATIWAMRICRKLGDSFAA